MVVSASNDSGIEVINRIYEMENAWKPCQNVSLFHGLESLIES
jgi:hypothetical protein